jgi:predicted outer membrane repeat protein
VLSSTALEGSSGSAADVQISSLWEGRVIDVGEGIDLEVRDLHVKDGTENDNGGNIQCVGSESNPSTLVLDNVLVTEGTVTGNSYGGGLLLFFCDATLTDTTFSGNSAEDGAGLVSFFSSLVVQDCEFTANVAADDVGGMAVVGDSLATTVTITDTRFENNEALSGGGAALLLSGTAAVISGSGPGTCVFHGNSAGVGEGGGIYLEDATVDVTACDFGTAGTAGDNSGGDIYLDDADRAFEYGEGETFSCDDTHSNLGICTPGTYDIDVGEPDSSNPSAGKLKGNIVDVTSAFTLNSFGVWLDPDTGCNSLDFYVMTSSDSSNWTMQWSDTVSTTTASAGWQQSGAVGFAVTAGQYVATMVGWTCDATYFWSGPGDELLPFGTSDGTVSSIAYLGFDSAPWTSPYWYKSMTTSTRYPTTYNVTQ